MDSAKAPVVRTSTFKSVAQLVCKIIQFRRSTTSSGSDIDGAPQHDNIHLHKLKMSGNLNISGVISESDDLRKEELDMHHQKLLLMEKEVIESLLANIFLSISAIKASYAQLQMSQVPFDLETVQAADFVIVAELGRISGIKQSYYKGNLNPFAIKENEQDLTPKNAALIAQIKEQQNLVKTYSITIARHEAELKEKDSGLLSHQLHLRECDKKVRALETKLYPGRTITELDDLHLSGLNSTHFLILLRYTYKSIRSFVKQMIKEMITAGWDLRAATCAIQLESNFEEKTENWAFAFESYVCQKMFSHFDKKNFNLAILKDRCSCDRKQFFDEFSKLKSLKLNECLSYCSQLGKFFRAKYLDLVHQNMESSFFGNLDQRNMINSKSSKFPDSLFFTKFSEMALRIWLLHCMFFSFEPKTNLSIFQVRKGVQYSEMYMENVVARAEDSVKRPLTVSFNVVPGFVVGGTVIQCKVCLSTSDSS